MILTSTETFAPDAAVETGAPNGSTPQPPRRGISVASLTDRVKVVAVEFDGETADIWYRPWCVTPRVLREMRVDQDSDDTDSIGRIMDQLVMFVSEWDVIDAAGSRLPVTVETMTDLPSRFLIAVLNAVIGDMNPTPTTPTGSFGG